MLTGPHIGFEYAWPMSLLVQAMTTDKDDEILDSLDFVLRASRLGLVHESINVNRIGDYTRSWFACKHDAVLSREVHANIPSDRGKQCVCTDDLRSC